MADFKNGNWLIRITMKRVIKVFINHFFFLKNDMNQKKTALYISLEPFNIALYTACAEHAGSKMKAILVVWNLVSMP